MSDDPKKSKTGRHYISLPIKEKLDAINQIKEGASVKEIANKLKVNPRTVRRWTRSEDLAAELQNKESIPAKRFRYRKAENNNVEEATWIWYRERRDAGIPVSRTEIRSQALVFHKVLGGKHNFVASEGWLSKWKVRYNIHDQAAEEFKDTFATIIQEENLSRDQIFICDEIGINYKMLPQGIFSVEGRKGSSGRKANEDRLTVLVCSNASATLKLRLMVVGKTEKPAPIKNWSNCPVHYKSQQSNLFEIWFKEIFVPTITKFLKDNKLPKKAILFVDNSTTHPRLKDDNIRIEYFPRNIVSILQLMDQGILKSLIMNYRKKLVIDLFYKRNHLGKNFKGAIRTINLRHGISWLSDAWNKVPESLITQAWDQIWPRAITSHLLDHEYIMEPLQPENVGTIEVETDATNEKIFQDLSKRFYQYILSDNKNSEIKLTDIYEWLCNPKIRDPITLSSFQEIIELITGESIEIEIISDDKWVEEMSLDEAKKCIDKLILYCERNRNSNYHIKEQVEIMYQLKDAM